VRKPSCLISCSHWLPEGSVVVLRHPAGRVRCNMRETNRIGQGRLQLQSQGPLCYDCVGHDAPGKLRYGKSRPPVRVPGGRGAFKVSAR
jgi:hypothetical protein